jgi:uncharacterized protein (UPF0248 family)
MTICGRCNKDSGLLGLLNFNKQTNRCGKCEREVQQGLASFRQNFLNVCSSRLLSQSDWEYLSRSALYNNLDLAEALVFIRGDALHFLERALTFFYADSIIQPDEEEYIRALLKLFAIPDSQARSLLDRLAYLKRLTEIRQGILPVVPSRLHLESDEICHLDMDATYYKVNPKSVTHISGRFIATNKKLHFLSPTGGAEIPWKRIMRIDRDGRGVYLELSTKKGNGRYDVTDPLLAEAVLETLVKIAKREVILSSADTASRHIPHDVRIAVWQRDQGRCVQCRATSYLEFDHIIPFSKGGASTVNNVQLLCRKCNLDKRDRI